MAITIAPKNEFIVLNDDRLETYTDFNDIPKSFDNLIKFNPHYIPPPHTDEEHKINAQWESKFKELMNREKK